MKRQSAEAVGSLAHHHGVDVKCSDVCRPLYLAQQLAEQRRGEGRNPMFVTKSIAQLADVNGQPEAVIGAAAADKTLLLQRLQQPAHGGAMQAAKLRQQARRRAAVEFI